MAKKKTKETTNKTPVPTVEQSLKLIANNLEKLFVLKEGQELTPAELLLITAQTLNELSHGIRNSTILLDHAVTVYRSLADRGLYPAELLPGYPEFLGRQGFKDYLNVLKGQAKFVVAPKAVDKTVKAIEAGNNGETK